MSAPGNSIRRTESRRPETPISCIPPYSFYSLSDDLAPKNRPLHRFLSLMRKTGARSFFLEIPERSLEEAQDDDAIAVRCQCNPREVESETFRLSFFRDELLSAADLARQTDEDFLGYCILRRVALPNETGRREWVYEAVPKWTPLLNNYLHSCAVFRCRVQDREFNVKGAYFAQQNDLTYVCFQSALRMALMHMMPAFGREIPYSEINDALGINHRDSAVGTYAGRRAGAVRHDRIENVFAYLRLRIGVVAWNFDPTETQPAPASLIYPFVESGYPAMLFFQGGGAAEGHVITVVGHTCNSDSWTPLAEKGYGVPTLPTYCSSSWADHLLVQDDNYGMYMCLARDCLSRWRRAANPVADGDDEPPATELEPEFLPLHGVGFLPLDVVRSPLNAELVSALALHQAAEQFLPTSEAWQRRLREAFTDADEPPVLRTFLSSKPIYLRHLVTMRDWHGTGIGKSFIDEVAKQLPDLFWLTEISLRDLFTGNRRKLGEVVSDTSIEDLVEPEEFQASWLAVRLPGIGIVRSADKRGAEVFEMELKGHTELLRLHCPRPTEW